MSAFGLAFKIIDSSVVVAFQRVSGEPTRINQRFKCFVSNLRQNVFKTTIVYEINEERSMITIVGIKKYKENF